MHFWRACLLTLYCSIIGGIPTLLKGQSPDLAKAQKQLHELNKLLVFIDRGLTTEIEQTITQKKDTNSQREPETNAEYHRLLDDSNEVSLKPLKRRMPPLVFSH